MQKVNDVIIDVLSEMRRQNEKWGEQNHGDYYWLGILIEETGEVARELIENAMHSYIEPVIKDGFSKVNVVVDRSTNPKLRKELVQVAAVAIQWICSMDHRLARSPLEDQAGLSLLKNNMLIKNNAIF